MLRRGEKAIGPPFQSLGYMRCYACWGKEGVHAYQMCIDHVDVRGDLDWVVKDSGQDRIRVESIRFGLGGDFSGERIVSLLICMEVRHGIWIVPCDRFEGFRMSANSIFCCLQGQGVFVYRMEIGFDVCNAVESSSFLWRYYRVWKCFIEKTECWDCVLL